MQWTESTWSRKTLAPRVFAAADACQVKVEPSKGVGPPLRIKPFSCLIYEVLPAFRLNVNNNLMARAGTGLTPPRDQCRPGQGGLRLVMAHESVPAMKIGIQQQMTR
jgi:hypothetical protein